MTVVDGQYNLPDYFVNAMELEPEGHVKTQGSFQRWVDSAISKTCNVPNNYTVEQVSKLYQMMYDLGCKGGTIYRDGSRDEQVLNVKKEETKSVESTDNDPNVTLPVRADHMNAIVLKGPTPYGNIFITISEDPTGVPFEIFINTGKSGSDLQAQGESIGRMLSLSLQAMPAVKRLDMLRILMEQNRGIGGARQHGLGPNRVSSFPDAIANIIQEQYLNRNEDVGPASVIEQANQAIETFSRNAISFVDSGSAVSQTIETQVEMVAAPEEILSVVYIKGANMCPECHNQSFVRKDGCIKCEVCGNSEC